MNIKFKIVIIGSGNVATQLGKALKKSGHEIVFVFSRTIKHASILGKKLNTSFGNNLKLLPTLNADVYILSVKDDAIADIVNKLPDLNNSLVIHTSGATDISVLAKKFKNCGVLWPIQTIKSNSKIDFKEVPIIIEACNNLSEKKLKQLALTLSSKIVSYNSKQRKIVHLAATLSNNFVNHIYWLAEQLLKKNNLPFHLLNPLILSTANLGVTNPYASQTGPAKRNDIKTMKAHLKLLPNSNYKELYKLLSKSISKSI